MLLLTTKTLTWFLLSLWAMGIYNSTEWELRNLTRPISIIYVMYHIYVYCLHLKRVITVCRILQSDSFIRSSHIKDTGTKPVFFYWGVTTLLVSTISFLAEITCIDPILDLWCNWMFFESYTLIPQLYKSVNDISSSSSSSVFCPRAGPSLQTLAPWLQFCPKVGLPLQTQEPRSQFY